VSTFTFDPDGNLIGSSGTITTPLLYDGQYNDTLMGFYYLRARWYDPMTAELTSVDPDVAQTGQPYLYAGDDPVNSSDPTGMWTAGECAEGNFSVLVSLGLNGCIIAQMNGARRVGDAAVTSSFSSALGLSLGATLGGGLDVSDARTWDQLRGPFEYAELDLDVLGGVGVILYWSPNFDIADPTRQDTVIGAEFNVAVGAEFNLSYGVLRTFVTLPPVPFGVRLFRDPVDWAWDAFNLSPLLAAEHWLMTGAPNEVRKVRQKQGNSTCQPS
jgi:RHS repeat-associated protein